jgi:16S rRNA (adenine1518-N6/adenine1519-N6)-dimethyltransferase
MDLFSPSEILAVLREHNLSLKKSFGQNFLINRDIVTRIMQYAGLGASDIVLEIGPGLGGMTRLMAERVRAVVAVEIDGGITRYLREAIREGRVQNVEVVNGDFLKTDALAVSRFGPPSKVVSNFPYSIGIRALVRIVDEFPSVHTIVGTVQRELAGRITASPGSGDYAAVSVYLQHASRISILEKRISPGSFFPKPAVDSSIIFLRVRRDSAIPRDRLSAFNEFLHVCFANRRKTLRNNLLHNLEDRTITALEGYSRNDLEELVEDMFSNATVRAEELSVTDFERLFMTLFLGRPPYAPV